MPLKSTYINSIFSNSGLFFKNSSAILVMYLKVWYLIIYIFFE
jgi:hypothetical protein